MDYRGELRDENRHDLWSAATERAFEELNRPDRSAEESLAFVESLPEPLRYALACFLYEAESGSGGLDGVFSSIGLLIPQIVAGLSDFGHEEQARHLQGIVTELGLDPFPRSHDELMAAWNAWSTEERAAEVRAFESRYAALEEASSLRPTVESRISSRLDRYFRNDPEAFRRALYESNGMAHAGQVLEALLPRFASMGLDPSALGAAAAAATDPGSFTDPAARQRLIDLLAKAEEGHLAALFREWLREPSVYLHMLIPGIYSALEAPSDALTDQVFAAGLDYPDPSLNRDFIAAALPRLGLAVALRRLLERTDRVSAAYYWTLTPRLHGTEDPETAALERELRRRLRPWAAYVKPWWKLW